MSDNLVTGKGRDAKPAPIKDGIYSTAQLEARSEKVAEAYNEALVKGSLATADNQGDFDHKTVMHAGNSSADPAAKK